MNNKITNPEFVKRMVVDGENLTMSREKFFKGEILTPEEITKIINTIPFHKEITWGNNRLSMLPWTGIEHLHQCIIDTVKRNVPGDFIETGAWRGGACIVAKSIYNDLKTDKKVFVADSFEGLPPPNIEKYPDDIKDTHYLDQNMKASLERLQERLSYSGLNSECLLCHLGISQCLVVAVLQTNQLQKLFYLFSNHYIWILPQYRLLLSMLLFR